MKMKHLYILSGIIDFAILLAFLTMPRTGMEAMGTAFVMIPLVAIRGIVGIIGLIVAFRRRRWLFMTYTLSAVLIIGGLWQYGWDLRPTHRPLYRALLMQARSGSRKLAEVKEEKVYDARRLMQKARDKDHARLCDLLTISRDVASLEAHLSQKPDLSLPCATLEGDRVGPILHAIIHSYGTWPHESRRRPPMDTEQLPAITRLLLAHGADPNVQDQRGDTPLHYALRHRHAALTEVLLAGGACVFLKNSDGEAPVHIDSHSRLGRLVQAAADSPEMIGRCPQVFPSKPSGKKREEISAQTANYQLLAALRAGRLEKAAEALAAGADPNTVDRDGTTLQAATHFCRDNNRAMLQMLLEAGADINQTNRKGQTTLVTAATRCYKAIPFLLERGADPTIADRQGNIALHDIVRYSTEVMAPLLEALLAAGADVNHANRFGQTPLTMTTFGSGQAREEAARILLARGADPNNPDHSGNTALHLLAADSDKHDNLGMMKLLLANGARLELRNHKEQTPLIAAVERRKVKRAQILIEAGAQVNVADKQGTPLIATLISCKPQKLALLKLLVAAGADVEATSKYGKFPLEHAFYGHLYLDCLEPARILLAAGANANHQTPKGQGQRAPIHAVAFWSKKDPGPALDLLLAHGARIDIRDDQGKSALLLAASSGNSLTPMKALLARGADLKAVDADGNTILHQLAMNTQPIATEALAWALAQGADPKAVNKAGETPLDRARKRRNQAMIEALSKLDKS